MALPDFSHEDFDGLLPVLSGPIVAPWVEPILREMREERKALPPADYVMQNVLNPSGLSKSDQPLFDEATEKKTHLHYTWWSSADECAWCKKLASHRAAVTDVVDLAPTERVALYSFIGGPADGVNHWAKRGAVQIEIREHIADAFGGSSLDFIHIYHVDPHCPHRMIWQRPKNFQPVT